LIFSGTNVIDKVINQKTLYYATSNNLCFCTNWQIGQTRILHFHSNAVRSQNSTSRCLISSVFLSLLYDSLDLVTNAYSSGLLEGMVQTKGSRERCSSWTVLHAQCTSALSSGFPLSQGNAEALDRRGGKTKHYLISNFLSNTLLPKVIVIGSCMSRLQHVKGGTFLRHSVIQFSSGLSRHRAGMTFSNIFKYEVLQNLKLQVENCFPVTEGDA